MSGWKNRRHEGRTSGMADAGPTPERGRGGRAPSRGLATIGAAWLLAAAAGASAQSDKYLIVAQEAFVTSDQLRNSLIAAGLTGTIDIYPQFATPTLGDVLQYNAVLTYSNLHYIDSVQLGNVLADYVDSGGGVVCAVRTVSNNSAIHALQGRWLTGGYEIIPARSGEVSTATTLGAVLLPGHPLWSGMTGFSGGTDYRRATTLQAAPHAVRVANWATGGVLVATSSLYPARVDLNFLPTAWHSTPAGARLIVNALRHAEANSNMNPGACCFANGSCQMLTGFGCWNLDGTFRGPGTDCATANCPQLGACCYPQGGCSSLLETACIAAGGIWQGPNSDCFVIKCPHPQPGACCLPSGCTLQTVFQCLPQLGVFRGENTACSAACLDLHFEVEPNNDKTEANPATLAVGQSIVGYSTGATGANPANPDYFRVRTTPAAPGIYRHRLTLASSGVHTVSIRGLTQNAAPAGPWPGPVGTATTTETGGQPGQAVPEGQRVTWYGFGREEELYYRVAGHISNITNYIATLSTEPVSPTHLGTFQAGLITISTAGMGHSSDTMLRVFDSNFAPIHGYANDRGSTLGGAPTNTNNTSHLYREYAPGTYYLALTVGTLATDQGAPCDDGRRTGAMLDFPGIAANLGGSSQLNVSFRIIDDNGAQQFPAQLPDQYEIAWFRFDVGGPLETGACCLFLGCNVVTESRCAALMGTYRGDGTACATANCPPTPGTVLVLPSQSNTLNHASTAMGLWFTAPTDFTIRGLRVPETVGHGLQNVELVRLSAAPPNSPSTTNSFVSLARHTGVPSATVIPVNVPVAAGDIIGILGTCGDSTIQHGSLGSAPFQTFILGQSASLRSLRMQQNLVTTPAQNLQNVASVLSRIEVYVSESDACYANCDESTVAPILNVDDFTCFINAYAAGQVLPHAQQVAHYANCDGSTIAPALNVDDFTCFINEYAAGCP